MLEAPVYANVVYTIVVALKNITLSAPEDAIERARLHARQQHTTLNEAFREWLEHFGGGRASVDEYRQMMADMRGVRPGRKFTREEMNERGTHS